MRQHSNMTNTAPIYVLLFGNTHSRMPPPNQAAIMELAYIFAGAGTLSIRDKHPTWFGYNTKSLALLLSLDVFHSTSLIDPSRPGRMVYWCPLVMTRDVLQLGVAVDDAAASESMTKLHDLATQAQLSPLAVLPDHVVPTALHHTVALQALGAYGPDVNLACI